MADSYYLTFMRSQAVPLNSETDYLCRYAEKIGLRFCIDFGFDNVGARIESETRTLEAEGDNWDDSDNSNDVSDGNGLDPFAENTPVDIPDHRRSTRKRSFAPLVCRSRSH